jgi:hypothetical protein
MTAPGQDASTQLWTIDMPKARRTSWNQTYQELTAAVGHALGLAMAFAKTKGENIRIEVEVEGARTVRVWVRSEADEFVALEAHVEQAPH